MDYPLLLYRGEEFNSNFFYLSQIDIDHSFLLLKEGKKTLFVPQLNEKIAREKFKGKVVVYKQLEDLAKYLKSKKTYFDARSTSVSLFKYLSKFTKLVDYSDKLSSLRIPKSSDEVSKIKKAVLITKKLFDSLDFSKFRTENDVRAFLLAKTYEKGISPAFEPIVATGRNSSFPHHHTSNKKLLDYVLIDYGVKYEKYNADLTRCFFLKKDEKKEQAYSKLKSIFFDIIDEFPDFSKASELASFSNSLFSKYKLPEQIHSIGHGLGLDVHEAPRLSLKSKDPLKKSVLAIEPGVYYKDFGARFEENIYFDGKKARIL